MIGLDIQVENKYNCYLQMLFRNVSLSGYKWKICCDDILVTGKEGFNHGLFDNELLDGEEFTKCILKQEYYIIFADLKAYHRTSQCKEIKNLQDFIGSDCELIFLCTDSIYIEIYCKNEEIIYEIRNNCLASVDCIKCEMIEMKEAMERNLVAW